MQEAEYIEVDAAVRYWEDAIVNDVEDDDGSRIPGRDGDAWKVRIHLETGKIDNWPKGVRARLHYKVCDAGLYWLQDINGCRIAQWSGSYVPTAFLCQGGQSHSDYIIMNIDSDGLIEKYKRPDINEEKWIFTNPEPIL